MMMMVMMMMMMMIYTINGGFYIYKWWILHVSLPEGTQNSWRSTSGNNEGALDQRTSEDWHGVLPHDFTITGDCLKRGYQPKTLKH